MVGPEELEKPSLPFRCKTKTKPQRRANVWNVNFRNSLWWPTYIKLSLKKKKKACGSLLIMHGLPRWKQIVLFWLLRSYDFETRYNSRDSFYFFYFF